MKVRVLGLSPPLPQSTVKQTSGFKRCVSCLLAFSIHIYSFKPFSLSLFRFGALTPSRSRKMSLHNPFLCSVLMDIRCSSSNLKMSLFIPVHSLWLMRSGRVLGRPDRGCEFLSTLPLPPCLS